MNRTNYTLLSIIAFSALYVVVAGYLANPVLLLSSLGLLIVAIVIFVLRDRLSKKPGDDPMSRKLTSNSD